MPPSSNYTHSKHQNTAHAGFSASLDIPIVHRTLAGRQSHFFCMFSHERASWVPLFFFRYSFSPNTATVRSRRSSSLNRARGPQYFEVFPVICSFRYTLIPALNIDLPYGATRRPSLGAEPLPEAKDPINHKMETLSLVYLAQFVVETTVGYP